MGGSSPRRCLGLQSRLRVETRKVRRRIDINEDAIGHCFDFRDALSMDFEQPLGAAIAAETHHFGKVGSAPQDRVAYSAVTRKNADGIPVFRREGPDQGRKIARFDERHVAEQNERAVAIGWQRR